MVNEKSWKEFKDSGLLWWINMLLHTFGWAIVFEVEGEEIKRVFPARVKFRGFGEEENTKGYQEISQYLADNATFLKQEADE
ncbi:hypothetical protein OK414_14705 [Priestia sp. JV24]|uniref:hypothetical protein n=1 Tax=Priestia TaxID=2800373 RepID=UPI0021D65437|nr:MULTISPECIES: hypothetical protein [Priestia]MCU7712467.1 hypothetical protein [Priestia megaterium]MCW1046296.1 hypothetical protein [Priestia sp. JV24]